jgi:ribosome-associated heat shock protein Hsp15
MAASQPPAKPGTASIRIDKLLFFLRFARSRALAKTMAEAGHIRLNRRRIDHAHAAVRPGDVLSLPLPSGVMLVEIIGLPLRRGPASIAAGHYRILDSQRQSVA